jgi:hypothetical protein
MRFHMNFNPLQQIQQNFVRFFIRKPAKNNFWHNI